jgi:hypothetical protein
MRPVILRYLLFSTVFIAQAQHDIQSHNDPQMSLDYHLVDPFALGDDEQDKQQSYVLDGCSSGGFWLTSWTRSCKSANLLLANSLLIPPAQHDIQSHDDPQMSLDYHLVDPFALGDDEQDEQQSDVLDGC